MHKLTRQPLIAAIWLLAVLGAVTAQSHAQQGGVTQGPFYPPTHSSEGRAGDADVQVMVFPAVMFKELGPPANLEDHLTFTYNHVVSMDVVQRDLIAYNKLTNKPLHEVEVTNGDMPLTGVKSVRTTSVTFMAPDVIVPATGHFDIAPFIEALKPYPVQRLAFIAPAGFQFTGLRTYKDSNVAITVTEGGGNGGSMYTYDVNVYNPSLTGLRLPSWQADPAQAQVAVSEPDARVRLVKILGIVLVGSVAALVGYVVYSVMIVRPSAV